MLYLLLFQMGGQYGSQYSGGPGCPRGPSPMGMGGMNMNNSAISQMQQMTQMGQPGGPGSGAPGPMQSKPMGMYGSGRPGPYPSPQQYMQNKRQQFPGSQQVSNKTLQVCYSHTFKIHFNYQFTPGLLLSGMLGSHCNKPSTTKGKTSIQRKNKYVFIDCLLFIPSMIYSSET